MNAFVKLIVKTIVNYLRRLFSDFKFKKLDSELEVKKGEMEHELDEAISAVDDFERKLAEYKASRTETDKLQ